MKRLLTGLLLTWSMTTQAGLPPTSSKGAGDSVFKTTFKTDYGTIPITRSGATATFGTIPVTAGGTGASSLTSNSVILGTGTSAVQFVAPGTSGNILTSNGTIWQSSPIGTGTEQVTIAGSTSPKIFGLNLSSLCNAGGSCTATKVLNTSVLGTTFSRNTTGVYTINFTGITNSVCTVVITPVSSQANKCQLESGHGTSDAKVQCFTLATASVDEGFSLNCFGY